jgi:hypothetical protein
VTLHARVTLDAVREQLTAEGFLRAQRKRVLGVFPSVEHVPARAEVVDALRAEARQVLEGPVPVAEVSERDAAVVALAAAAELPTLVPGRDRRRHHARVAELAERSGAAAPALRKVVTQVHTALTASLTAIAGATGD